MGTPDQTMASKKAVQANTTVKPNAAPELGGVGGEPAVAQGREVQEAATQAEMDRLMTSAPVGMVKAYSYREGIDREIIKGITDFVTAATPTPGDLKPDLASSLAATAVGLVLTLFAGSIAPAAAAIATKLALEHGLSEASTQLLVNGAKLAVSKLFGAASGQLTVPLVSMDVYGQKRLAGYKASLNEAKDAHLDAIADRIDSTDLTRGALMALLEAVKKEKAVAKALTTQQATDGWSTLLTKSARPDQKPGEHPLEGTGRVGVERLPGTIDVYGAMDENEQVTLTSADAQMTQALRNVAHGRDKAKPEATGDQAKLMEFAKKTGQSFRQGRAIGEMHRPMRFFLTLPNGARLEYAQDNTHKLVSLLNGPNALKVLHYTYNRLAAVRGQPSTMARTEAIGWLMDRAHKQVRAQPLPVIDAP